MTGPRKSTSLSIAVPSDIQDPVVNKKPGRVKRTLRQVAKPIAWLAKKRHIPSESNQTAASPRTSRSEQLIESQLDGSLGHSSQLESQRSAPPRRTTTQSDTILLTTISPVEQPCQECAVTQEQAAGIREKLQQTEAKAAAVQQQYDDRCREVEGLRKQLEDQQHSNEQISGELARTMTGLEAARQDASALQHRNEQISEELARTTTELEAARRDASALQNKNEQIGEALARTTIELEATRQDVYTLQHTNEQISEEMARTTIELEAARKDASALQHRNEQIGEEMARTTTELEVARQDASTLQHRNEQISGELVRITTELEAARKDASTPPQQQRVETELKPKQAAAEIATLRRQQDQDRQELDRLRGKLDEEQRGRQEMNDSLARIEAQLMTARNDAAALRLFNEEENVDGETVRTLFSDLVTGIDDLVFSVFEKLSEAEVNSPIAVDRRRFAATNTGITNKLWPFIASVMGTQPKVETVAMPAMHCIASSIIFAHFLEPFCPVAVDFDRDNFCDGLMRLWNVIAERESSQEVIGRWRSITYRAVRQPQADDDAFLENVAKHLLASLRDVVLLLLPQQLASTRDWEKLINSLKPRAVKVLRKAIGFQTMTQATCVSWDYMVYHPHSDGSFIREMMEVDAEVLEDHATVLEGRPVHGSRVLLATSLGLQAHRKGLQSQEASVIQKARIAALRVSTPTTP